jgi:nucleotide-binding universal stress UspA family protein
MKKILVPVDFSDHTETVCKFALEIAKKAGGEIRLFHAYFDYVIIASSSFPYSVDTSEMFNQEMMVKIREEAKADLQKLEDKLVDELNNQNIRNVRVVHTLTGGIPEDEILNTAETYDPDIIVMGTRGKGNKDILTGKVTSKVVKNAKCRILTVPINAKYSGFENMLYATNLANEDEKDLRRLFELLITYRPLIHCVHINIDNDKVADEDKMNSLKAYFEDEINEGRLIFRVIDNVDFLEGINTYVNDNHIDIISIVHHRKGFLKSLFTKDHTRELLFHADIPLYIFPGNQE